MSLLAMSLNKGDKERVQRATLSVAASLAIVMGGISLLTWLSHGDWLWVSSLLFRMKFNTALAAVAGGAGLFAVLRSEKSCAITIGVFLLAVGGLTSIEYLTGLNLAIDELLIADYRFPETPFPGRMAPNAAFGFSCTGMVLILLSQGRQKLSRVVVTEILSFAVLAVGATAILGHLTNAELAYDWGSVVVMSLGTSMSIFALGVGLVTLTWEHVSTRIASVPLWIPLSLCFLVLLIDLATPRGLAAGIAYIPIIISSLWFTQRRTAFVFAAITTALTVLGYVGSPPGDSEFWISVANRVLTIGSLWAVATLVYLRRRSESILQKYMRDLERSNQELDDFAYIASHDLKEPLRGVFNHASFLLEDYRDQIDGDGVRRLNRLGQLCQRMERLINDLMYFSRLGRADLAVQETDPNAVIVEIQQMMETLLGERRARIVVPRTLPRILCDRTRVTEVFRNLITNAVKYNDKTECVVEIGFLQSVNTKERPEKNVFYVRDNGVGIDPEFHQEIFRIFKRLQPASEAQETGTGVGLTFVKKIIERHGGRIWLESESGKGTVFYFSLNGA
jgi:signal transduction histidine kinase